PPADHEETLRDLQKLEGLLRADDPLPVEAERREVRGPPTSRDDRASERDCLLAVGGLHPYIGGRRELRVPVEHVYPIPFAQLCNPRGEALDDAPLPILKLLHVDMDVGNLDAVLLRLAGGGDDLRRVCEGLRGDATVIQALPAEAVPFHEEDLLPE